MRALVQRVSRASVDVEGETVGSIATGLCALVGVTHSDTPEVAKRLAEKLWHLRVFHDTEGAMNVSAADRSYAILVISQFTLYSDTRRGRRPSFVNAARPEIAEPLCTTLVDELRTLGAHVETGRFGADMRVSLVNEGPVTLMIDV